MINTWLKKVKEGDLLQGAKTVSQRGVEEWFNFPRHKVVAIHMNRKTMFVETLDRDGNSLVTEKLDFNSNQWRHWK